MAADTVGHSDYEGAEKSPVQSGKRKDRHNGRESESDAPGPSKKRKPTDDYDSAEDSDGSEEEWS